MTKLGFLNRFLLQFFFIRLARKIDDNGKQIGYTVVKWVVPFTGWKSDYIFISRKKG